MWMMKCSNCEAEVDLGIETTALVLKGGPKAADPVRAVICDECQKGVLTLKIVLKRDESNHPFYFEQYLPVENAKI